MTEMFREAAGSVVLPIEKGVTDIPPMSTLARSQTVQNLDVTMTFKDVAQFSLKHILTILKGLLTGKTC